jgi:uncharacterized protein YkwD
MKPTLALLFLFSVVALADDKPAAKIKLSDDEKTILDLLNQERKKEKVDELVLHPTLCKVAKQHSENMAKQEKLSHKLDDKGVAQRVTDAGYDYRSIGENLAMSEVESGDDAPPSTPKEIHQKWMESKGHRENILASKYREVGISIVRSKKGTYYYTQVFGVQR